MTILYIYLGIINFISGFFFYIDKKAAIKDRARIPEKTLHMFELIGGVFANIVLIYLIRHKNQKFSYWIWTWIIFIAWGCLIYFLKQYAS